MMNYLFQETPLKLFVQSFWRDESFSYLVARQNIFDLISSTAKDFNPPLYYLILKMWMFIFGTSEIALRSLSFVFFMGTLYILYLIMTEIIHLSGKKSVLYLLLFIYNPILIYYAFEARMYSMLAFFATLSFYAYYRRKMTLHAIATTLGIYTHYFMFFVLLVQGLHALLYERTKPHFIYLLKRLSLPVVFFIPWVLVLISQKRTFADSFWIPKVTLSEILMVPGQLYTGYEKDLGFLKLNNLELPALLVLLSILITVVTIFGYIKSRIDSKESVYHLFTFFLLWAFVPTIIVFVLSFFRSYFLPRYLIFTVPGILLLLIMSLEHMKLLARIFFIIALIFMTHNYRTDMLKYRLKSNVARTIKEIRALAKKDDVLYVTNELDFFNAQYYFYPDRVFIYHKSYDEVPSFTGKVLMPKEKFVVNLPIYPKKAFVLTDDDHYEIRSSL